MACEYLLLNGIPIDVADETGYTALHLATEKGSTAQAFLLLKHRAKHDTIALNNKRPIDIAVEQANADIVTLYVVDFLFSKLNLNYIVVFNQPASDQPQRGDRSARTRHRRG